jgi:hypothetical protein
MIWRILDIFFIVFHTGIIIFSLTGWILKKTRRLNLIVLGIIGSSWLFLGLVVGMLGYCPLTDWHFNVLEKLGKTDLPNSYVKYLADRLIGLDFNSHLVDSVTIYAFLIALLISIVLNVRDLARNHKREHN